MKASLKKKHGFFFRKKRNTIGQPKNDHINIKMTKIDLIKEINDKYTSALHIY